MSTYIQIGTCGGREKHDWSKFDFYHYNYFWEYPEALELANKYNKKLRTCLLWGSRNRTIEDLRGKRELATSEVSSLEGFVEKFCSIREFDSVEVINEFIKDDGGLVYPIDRIKGFIKIVRSHRPKSKILISEFKPWQEGRWQKVYKIASSLDIDGVGIQVHLKAGYNAPLVLSALPHRIQQLKNIGVEAHLTEVSVWQKGVLGNPSQCWKKLWDISKIFGVSSVTPWWIDSIVTDYMPSFRGWKNVGFNQ